MNLADLLETNGIDLTRWGQGAAKTVAALKEEIESGDCVLEQDTLKRVVHAVVLHLVQNEQIVIEVSQTLRDGRVRERQLPPSEKMKPSEDSLEAARRCAKEELDIELVNPTIKERYQHVMDSISYPGLHSVYEVVVVEARPQHPLPATSFTTKEQSPTDPVITHHWGWQAIE